MLKWIGVSLCLLLFAAWAWSASLRWQNKPIVGYRAPSFNICLNRGTVSWQACSPSATLSNGWYYHPAGPHVAGISWHSHAGLCWPRIGSQPGRFDRGHIPLWLPFILIALPTALLWHRDRKPKRYPPGHCKTCGYDLTGNESGTCPECGTEADRA